MSKKLNTTVRAYLSDGNILKRYIRIAEAAKFYEIDSESTKIFASAASAVYQLPRTTLINHMKMEELGLVEKRRRGLGLPSLLYVKSFIVDGWEENSIENEKEIIGIFEMLENDKIRQVAFEQLKSLSEL